MIHVAIVTAHFILARVDSESAAVAAVEPPPSQQSPSTTTPCGDNAEQHQQQHDGEETSNDATLHKTAPIYDRPRNLVNGSVNTPEASENGSADATALQNEDGSRFPLQIELVSGAHAPPACELLSHSQQELVDIIRRVKGNELTMDNAEDMFTNWKLRNKQGLTKSFRERKVRSTYIFSNWIVD